MWRLLRNGGIGEFQVEDSIDSDSDSNTDTDAEERRDLRIRPTSLQGRFRDAPVCACLCNPMSHMGHADAKDGRSSETGREGCVCNPMSHMRLADANPGPVLMHPPSPGRILTLPPKLVGRDVEPLQRSKFSNSGLKQAKIGS